MDDLPTGSAQGDVYNVTSTGANYAWTGSAWDNIGGIEAVDTTPVQSSTNPVSSGGVYSALENLQGELEGQISTAGAQPSTSTPLVAGTAAVGTQTAYARGDHRHPAQTSVSGNAGTATKLATARTLALSGDVTGSTSFDGSANRTIAATLVPSGVTAGSYGPESDANLSFGGSVTVPQVTVDAKGRVTEAAGRAIKLPAAPTSVSGNAGTATKLATARTIRTNLGSTSTASFDGSANVAPGVTGILPVANGGTGNSTGTAAAATKATQDGNGNVIVTTYATKAEVSSLGMPVGSIYVQFSGQSAPADLFGGTWSNVSSTYAGLFFRAEGGSAAAFGSSQAGGLPNIAGTFDRPNRNYYGTVDGAFYNPNLPQGGFSRGDSTDSSLVGFDASLCHSLFGAANEVRPVNSTIRIWKRTA